MPVLHKIMLSPQHISWRWSLLLSLLSIVYDAQLAQPNTTADITTYHEQCVWGHFDVFDGANVLKGRIGISDTVFFLGTFENHTSCG